MNDNITKETLSNYLAVFIEQNNLITIAVAKVIGCSTFTIERIIANISYPSIEMLKQCGILFAIGYEDYRKLSKAEKKKISEIIGAVVGGGIGIGAISSVISASGAIVGLSAVGITSGLASIGAVVGGGMVAGVVVAAAALPIAVGATGYAVMKGIKFLINKSKLNTEDFNEYWEQRKN